MDKIQLHDIEGKVVGSVELPSVLEGPVNKALLWQAIRLSLANQREGNAQTKTRGEVRGGGKKPWAQKHTGRARHGTIRSPIWRKGGVVFGPHPREYRYQLPAQMRRSALVESLKAKVNNNAVVALQTFEGLEPKTKALSLLLKRVQAPKGALLVVDRPNSLLARISRNLPRVVVRPAGDLNCYEVLAHPSLVVTTEGLNRLKGLLS